MIVSRGRVWRTHKKTYEATNVGGALRYSARYMRMLSRSRGATVFLHVITEDLINARLILVAVR